MERQRTAFPRAYRPRCRRKRERTRLRGRRSRARRSGGRLCSCKRSPHPAQHRSASEPGRRQGGAFEDVAREPTQRARSFLFAALGAVNGAAIRPQYDQVFRERHRRRRTCRRSLRSSAVARPERPILQVLQGFERLLSTILARPLEVSNPYIWLTKAQVVNLIMQQGFGDLIRCTRSCPRIREMSNLHTHCGRCSQCIDRRFAILASDSGTCRIPVRGLCRCRLVHGRALTRA